MEATPLFTSGLVPDAVFSLAHHSLTSNAVLVISVIILAMNPQLCFITVIFLCFL